MLRQPLARQIQVVAALVAGVPVIQAAAVVVAGMLGRLYPLLVQPMPMPLARVVLAEQPVRPPQGQAQRAGPASFM